MSNNVMRKTGVDHSTTGSGKIAKHQGLIPLGVERVGISESVGRYLDLVSIKPPAHSSTQSEFKARQGLHHNGVDILSVEVWVIQYLAVRNRSEWITIAVRVEGRIIDW